MNIYDHQYSVTWDEATGQLSFSGTLQLMRKDYRPICDLLDWLQRRRDLTRLLIDITRLQIINSSGLNALSRFVLGMRARPTIQVSFRGARATSWQHKMLANMKSFLPTADVELL